jgi:hypothetical protein
MIDHVQPARQIDSHFDAVTLHQFDALIQSFTEHLAVDIPLGTSARRGIAWLHLKRLRVGEWRVHEVTFVL